MFFRDKILNRLEVGGKAILVFCSYCEIICYKKKGGQKPLCHFLLIKVKEKKKLPNFAIPKIREKTERKEQVE